MDEEEKKVHRILSKPVAIKMTLDDERKFHQATHCHICGNLLHGYRCRGHDHLSENRIARTLCSNGTTSSPNSNRSWGWVPPVREVKQYLESKRIKLFSTVNVETKAAVVERWLRTLKSKLFKYFTFRNRFGSTIFVWFYWTSCSWQIWLALRRSRSSSSA